MKLIIQTMKLISEVMLEDTNLEYPMSKKGEFGLDTELDQINRSQSSFLLLKNLIKEAKMNSAQVLVQFGGV